MMKEAGEFVTYNKAWSYIKKNFFRFIKIKNI